MKPLEEVYPADFILFHALGSTQNLTITVLIDSNGNQNSHIFVFSAPISFQVNSIHIHIGILSSLEGAVAPNLDICISLLMVGAEALLPHRASVMSSTRRTETPARYISMSASSTLLSRRRYRSMIAVSNGMPFKRGMWSVTSPEVVVSFRS